MPMTAPGVEEAVALYAAGWFPMDGPEHAAAPLPFFAAHERAVLDLDPAARAALRRRVRRSLRRASGWRLQRDDAFETVLAACARPRGADDGVWITPRLQELYRRLHGAGIAHSLELWDDEAPVAGILAVLLGRAAMLESMAHWRPHAGNALLARALDALAADGFELCDVQLPTEHTMRLGARLVPRATYEARLRAALAP
jgi:leucyl/phenylalanyl-tRNA---protein transferase